MLTRLTVVGLDMWLRTGCRAPPLGRTPVPQPPLSLLQHPRLRQQLRPQAIITLLQKRRPLIRPHLVTVVVVAVVVVVVVVARHRLHHHHHLLTMHQQRHRHRLRGLLLG